MHEHIYNYTTPKNTGSINSKPSKVTSVCAEVDPTDQGRLMNSWDHLPCHLQNGANIAHYIIHYNTTSGREVETILSTDSKLCWTSGDRCVITTNLSNEIYTFQVAAHSSNGAGQLSDPVYAMLGNQGSMCTYYCIHILRT